MDTDGLFHSRALRLALSFAGVFLLGTFSAWLIRHNLSAASLTAHVQPYVRPATLSGWMTFLVSVNLQPMLACLVFFAAAEGSLLYPIGLLWLGYRGFAYGWITAMLPLFPASYLLPALLTVSFLEACLYGLVLYRLANGRRSSGFLTLTGTLLLLHTLSFLILFSP